MHSPAPCEEARSWRVLVIEDNPINMKIVEVTLRRAGMQVIPATSAAEGLALARSVAPDVVLCDLSLPDMDGIDVARALVDLPFPVVAVTAHVLAEDERRCREAGMSGFVGKPIDVHGLARQIQQIHTAWSRARRDSV